MAEEIQMTVWEWWMEGPNLKLATSLSDGWAGGSVVGGGGRRGSGVKETG